MKPPSDPVPEIVVIGVSRGGFHALQRLFAGIPQEFCVPIVIVQHRHKTSNELLGQMLEKWSSMPVRDASDKLPVERGTIYLAPADYHLMIEPERVFSLSTEGPVRYSRPSIDVLFESAADVYGASLIGVILTGANDDGAAGVRAIKQNGGTVIVQDPATAESPEMPSAAIAAAEVDRILPLEEISSFLVRRCVPAFSK